MRVLLGSPAFPPSLGGLERVVEQLAEGLAVRGHEVAVLTRTAGGGDEGRAFRVVRNPGFVARLVWMRWCDVFLQANLSLRDLLPWILVRPPWVVSHHGLYGGTTWRSRLLARVKMAVAHRADASIVVSRFLAERIPGRHEVVANPYREELFRERPQVARSKDVIFVGRLVSEKGCALLLEAFAEVVRGEREATLTVAGAGPEREALVTLARTLGVAHRVHFAGRVEGEELAGMLAEHRILVVPSLVEEGFGVVALEGIACGCVVVAAAAGGLPEAIGECGVLFPRGDRAALAAALETLLERRNLAPYRSAAREHLSRFQSAPLVERYCDVLRRAAGGGR